MNDDLKNKIDIAFDFLENAKNKSLFLSKSGDDEEIIKFHEWIVSQSNDIISLFKDK